MTTSKSDPNSTIMLKKKHLHRKALLHFNIENSGFFIRTKR